MQSIAPALPTFSRPNRDVAPPFTTTLFAEYTRFQQLRDSPIHTDNSLEYLQNMALR
jgi:hypothetical protein